MFDQLAQKKLEKMKRKTSVRRTSGLESNQTSVKELEQDPS